jgi:hypothetical protein
VTAADPFEGVVIRERIGTAALVALIGAIPCAIAYFGIGRTVTSGTIVKAEILQLSTYPTGRGAGGDLPVLTVRLPDGSIRNVTATWADVDNCAPGRWISLLEQGRALQVGRPGCNPKS